MFLDVPCILSFTHNAAVTDSCRQSLSLVLLLHYSRHHYQWRWIRGLRQPQVAIKFARSAYSSESLSNLTIAQLHAQILKISPYFSAIGGNTIRAINCVIGIQINATQDMLINT